MNMDPEKFNERQKIVQAAVDLYVKDRDHFTIKQLAENLEMKASDIYRLFPNKNAILRYYYTSLVLRYRLMIDEIEDFDEYTLAEKLSNFMYANFDMMLEEREFVAQTFKRKIHCASGKTEYQKEVEKLFKEFLTTDRRVASSSQILMKDIFYHFQAKGYFNLIQFWLEDTSDDFEKTMAYIDKITAFIQEVMYTAVLDRGFDLLKFMTSNGVVISKVPIFGPLIVKWFKEQ